MTRYLLSVHSSTAPPDDAAPEPTSDAAEHHADGMAAIMELEEALDAAGAWVFSGHLTGPDAATVVAVDGAGVVTTDGPFAESKEHLAGFYLIEASDLDEALRWAERVTRTVGAPIEVRAFAATGHVRDQMG